MQLLRTKITVAMHVVYTMTTTDTNWRHTIQNKYTKKKKSRMLESIVQCLRLMGVVWKLSELWTPTQKQKQKWVISHHLCSAKVKRLYWSVDIFQLSAVFGKANWAVVTSFRCFNKCGASMFWYLKGFVKTEELKKTVSYGFWETGEENCYLSFLTNSWSYLGKKKFHTHTHTHTHTHQ